MKSEEPEIVKAPRFSSTRWWYVFLLRIFLDGSHPCVARLRLPEQVVNMSFSISGAKVQHFFDICKFLAKKMQKKSISKRKREISLPFSPNYTHTNRCINQPSAGLLYHKYPPQWHHSPIQEFRSLRVLVPP